MDVVKGSSTENREKAAFLFSFFSFFFQILERHCILKVNENRGKLRIVTADSKFRVWKNEKKNIYLFVVWKQTEPEDERGLAEEGETGVQAQLLRREWASTRQLKRQ